MSPDIHPGDRVQTRKAHPCGSDEWIIYRVGADIGLRCTGCNRHVMLPRATFYRRLKKILVSQAGYPQREGNEG